MHNQGSTHELHGSDWLLGAGCTFGSSAPEPAHGGTFSDMGLRSQPADSCCSQSGAKAGIHLRGTVALPTFTIFTGGIVFQKHLLDLLGHQDTNGR